MAHEEALAVRFATRSIPGAAEWMRRQQARKIRKRASRQDRTLIQRLNSEANTQAQRAINREGHPPSQDERTVSIPSLAGLRRSPKKLPVAAK